MKLFIFMLIALVARLASAEEIQLDGESQARVLQQLQVTGGVYFKRAYAIDNFTFKYRRPTPKDLSTLKRLAKTGSAFNFSCQSESSSVAVCTIVIVEPETFDTTLSITLGLEITNPSAPKILEVFQITYARSMPRPLKRKNCDAALEPKK